MRSAIIAVVMLLVATSAVAQPGDQLLVSGVLDAGPGQLFECYAVNAGDTSERFVLRLRERGGALLRQVAMNRNPGETHVLTFSAYYAAPGLAAYCELIVPADTPVVGNLTVNEVKYFRKTTLAQSALDPPVTEAAELPVTAEQPVQAKATLEVPAGEGGGTVELFDVPEGMLLIIEYLTIRVDSRDEQQAQIDLRTELRGQLTDHAMEPLPPQVATGVTSGYAQTLQRSLRAYSDGPVVFRYQRGTGLLDRRAIIDFTMSGRLVPDPAP